MINLEWLARNVSEWPSDALVALVYEDKIANQTHAIMWLTPQELEEDTLCIHREQWEAERVRLGLDQPTPTASTKPNKYQRTIKGTTLDVYDILEV